MTVQEIEQAVTRLESEDLAEFTAWFADYRARLWDAQIERDLKKGRLDALLEEVDAENEALPRFWEHYRQRSRLRMRDHHDRATST